jgi:putative hydrolase
MGDDAFGEMLGNLSGMMAPALLGMSIGSMVGALAQRAFGQYDLPLPRVKTDELLLVPSSVDGFAEEWSISKNDARMWVLIHELTSHAVLSTSAARSGVTELVKQHVAAFRPDPAALMDRLSSLDMNDASAMEEMQRVFSDPTLLMGAVRTREQENLAPLLEAHVSAVIAYIDHVVDAVSARILGGGGHIAEAVRRRRLDSGPDAVFVEHLLGLKLTRQQLARGREFIDGVCERTSDDSILHTLVSNDGHLPTPSEIDAPGLWLARIELN